MFNYFSYSYQLTVGLHFTQREHYHTFVLITQIQNYAR